MASNAGNDKVKKPIIDEDFRDDEESNKKVIILIILLILIVLGLIIGSLWFFGKDDEGGSTNGGEDGNKTPVITPSPDEDDTNPDEDTNIEGDDGEDNSSNDDVIGGSSNSENNTGSSDNTVADNTEDKDENTPSDNEESEEVVTVIFLDEFGQQIGETQYIRDYTELIEPELPTKHGYRAYWVEACDVNGMTCTFQVEYEQILVNEDYSTYTVFLNGRSIEVDGEVLESSKPDEFGNRTMLKLRFNVPSKYDEADVYTNGTVTIAYTNASGSVTEMKSIASLPNGLQNDGGILYFEIDIPVDNEEEIPEITIDWADGDEVTFDLDITNLEKTSYASQIGVGTITESEEEKTETGVVEPTYEIEATEKDTNDTTLTIEGEVNNYETKTGLMENLGFSEDNNNILVIKFTSPEGITDFTNLKITTTEGEFNGSHLMDGENYFYHYQAVDPGTTSNPQVKIDWDGSGELPEETYTIDTTTIKLTPDANIDATVEAPTDTTYEQNLVNNHDGDNIIDVTGTVPYDEVDGNNTVETTFKPESTVVVDENKITVTDKDNNDIYDSNNLSKDEEGNYSYTHKQEVSSNTDAPTITIDWDGSEGASEEITYEYDFTDATIESSETESTEIQTTDTEITNLDLVDTNVDEPILVDNVVDTQQTGIYKN